MKILFVNKYDTTGGAGIVAHRLHQELEQTFSTENSFIVGIKRSNNPRVFCSRNNLVETFIERGLNVVLNLAGLQYVYFPFSTSSILRKARELKPDVISLHNIHGGYFETSLLIELSRIAPIVWTLHDMWAFTGNAAHTFGNDSWRVMKAGPDERRSFPQIGLPTGSWLLKRKKDIYQRSDLTVVTPSQWLRTLAQQAPVFESKKIVSISNGIDLGVFHPSGALSREQFHLPQHAKVLMFTAEKMKNEFKGGKSLLTVLQRINDLTEEPIHVLIVGQGKMKEVEALKKLVVRNAGYIADELSMARYFSAADVFIYPTRADTLPNALIESIACGTPCVTFDIGGCTEVIRHNFNGYVTQPFDAEAFARHTIALLKNPLKKKYFSQNARRSAEEKFSLASMARKYFELFTEVVEKRGLQGRG